MRLLGRGIRIVLDVRAVFRGEEPSYIGSL